ncbi:MAG: hypothetical protein ACE5R4_16455 [Armatimonadota bacterium]
MALMGLAAVLVCATPLAAQASMGVLFPERGLTRDLAAAREEIIAALQERMAAAGASGVQWLDPQGAAERQALKQAGLKPGHLEAPQSAERLAPFARALGLDWLLVMELKQFEARLNMVKSRAWVACRLIAAATAEQADIDVVKTDGDRQGLRDIEAREATPEQILAILVSNRLWPRVAAHLGQADLVPVEPPDVGPVEPPDIGPVEPADVGPVEPPDVGPIEPPHVGPVAPPDIGPVEPGDVGPSAMTAEERVFALDRQIREQGESAALRIALGEAYLTIGDYGQAEFHLLRATVLDPKLPEPHLRLGEIRTNQKRWRAAVDEYREAVRLDPGNINARIALARSYERAGASKEALSEFEAAARLDPDNGVPHLELGDFYARQHDNRAAEREYRLAADCAEPDTRAYGRLADYYAEKGQFKESFDYHLRAIRHQTNPLVMDERRYGKILALADEALAKQMADSNAAMTRFRRGRMTREEAYYAFQGFADYSRDIYNLAAAVTPPATARAVHQARLLVYSLANQADLSLLEYLDTNDDADFETAKVLRAEAVQEFARLRQQAAR